MLNLDRIPRHCQENLLRLSWRFKILRFKIRGNLWIRKANWRKQRFVSTVYIWTLFLNANLRMCYVISILFKRSCGISVFHILIGKFVCLAFDIPILGNAMITTFCCGVLTQSPGIIYYGEKVNLCIDMTSINEKWKVVSFLLVLYIAKYCFEL